MILKSLPTFWVKLYLSGPIDVAKQIIRKSCLDEGLCVTIEPTTFIYTGGEEQGYVVGLINYPRFPRIDLAVEERARSLASELLKGTHQRSVLIQTPTRTDWYTIGTLD